MNLITKARGKEAAPAAATFISLQQKKRMGWKYKRRKKWR
jgi:hypothetical protein